MSKWKRFLASLLAMVITNYEGYVAKNLKVTMSISSDLGPTFTSEPFVIQ